MADNITLRGFASGGHGGDIGMVMDGIPLNEAMSHADGYVDQNIIIPLEVERMTVFKGPSSVLYGSYGLGGTLAFTSRKGGNYAELATQAGSHATWDTQAAFGVEDEKTEINLAAQYYRSNGFREQSGARRGTFAGRVGVKLTPVTTLAVSARAHQGHWDSASYVTARQNDSGDRYAKDPRVQNDHGRKRFYTARVDLGTSLNEQLRLLSYVYHTQQAFTRSFSRPVSAVQWRQREDDYDRKVYGAGFSLNGMHALAGREADWVLGTEWVYERTRHIHRDGLNNRENTPATTAGALPYLDRDYDSRNWALFGRLDLRISPYFQPSVGFRYDRLSGACGARAAEIPNSGPPCGPMAAYHNFSPKLAVRSAWTSAFETRLSYSEGFQLPSSSARYGTDAGAGLKPMRLQQFEVGLSWRPVNGMYWDAALFRLDSRDETLALGPGVYESFGKTRRQGLELEVGYAVTQDLDLVANMTWMHTRVLQGADASAAGRQLPGVAKRVAHMRGVYRFAPLFSAELVLRYNAGSPASADGSAWTEGYTTADLTLAYQPGSAGPLRRLYVSVRNLANRRYSTHSLVMGGQQMYAPAAARSVMAGMDMSF